MAESLPEGGVGDSSSDNQPENVANLECAVCLQTCVYPAELPCGHVFCYLCIKGIVNRNRRCAMCRQTIPADFLDNPRLLRPVEHDFGVKGSEDGYSWFYEGHNGWWQYDERTSAELESAYQSGERCYEILVAGYVYVADFDSMLQYRRSNTCKRRRIKRDLTTSSIKGVAGLKLTRGTPSSNSSSIVSNILIPGMENLHISNRRTGLVDQRAELSRLNSLTSRLSIDSENDSVFTRDHSLSPLLPAYPHGFAANLRDDDDDDLDSEDNFYLRNSDIDGMLHSSLDWTIQQMESLQAQLSSDYDSLNEESQYDALSDFITPGERPGQRTFEDSLALLNRSVENNLGPENREARQRGTDNSDANMPQLATFGYPREEHLSDSDHDN